jgi:DNA-binding NarL/FixJ family response regulator
MSELRRAINAVLREGRPMDSFRDAANDLGEAAELLARGAGGKPLDLRGAEAHIEQLPEPDRSILRARQSGMGRREIARELGLEEIVVFRALVRTYAELRIQAL